jgi:hypothetical protein
MKRLLDSIEELPELIANSIRERGDNGSNDGEHEVLWAFTEWACNVLTELGMADRIPADPETDDE